MENLGIEPVLQYHQLKYHAEANWNLIINFEHPVSFEHTANGFCVDSGIKISWQLPSSWSVLLVGNCATWKTGKGIDKLHLKNSPAVYSQFNGAARKEYRAGIEVCKAF
jgi:hypothetical protein